MKPVVDHPWKLPPSEAIRLQKQLAQQVSLQDNFDAIQTVCGLDVSYDKFDDTFFAVAAVLSFPELKPLEIVSAQARSPFPYIPGLLSFREIPVLAHALTELQQRPDLLVCDGQGYAHPRRFGLACHLGVLYDIPAVGLAKSRLIGKYEEPKAEKGAWSWLLDDEDRIGQVVRTRTSVVPLFVSPGHRICFHSARKLALALCPKWRQPETTRIAHREVNRIRRLARGE